MSEAFAPKCSALKKDGSPCGNYAMTGKDKCPGHAGIIGGDTTKGRDKDGGHGSGQGGPQGPLTDAAKARAALMKIVTAGRADPTTVAAAREILAQAGASTQAKPRSVRQVEGMRTDELIPLLRTLELAHHMPEGEMMGQIQA